MPATVTYATPQLHANTSANIVYESAAVAAYNEIDDTLLYDEVVSPENAPEVTPRSTSTYTDLQEYGHDQGARLTLYPNNISNKR
jgi:hypothetical protein